MTSQAVSISIKTSGQSWIFTGVYASPSSPARREMWHQLNMLRETSQSAWLLIGDFNDIMVASEQRGGTFDIGRADIFAQQLELCGLLDLNLMGAKFTWHRRRNGLSLHKRLDRAVCDILFRTKFPEAVVEVLPRGHSDHNPLLLRCGGFPQPRGDLPFRFKAAWCTHAAYCKVVHDAWNCHSGNVLNALNQVRMASITFNQEVFGNIFVRKRELQARIRGLERYLERIDSVRSWALYHDLQQQYETCLFQEETLWYQKYREQWIKLSSRNTSLFHAQAVVRWKCSKVHGLFLASGEWCTDAALLQQAAYSFYQTLFGEAEEVRPLRDPDPLMRLNYDDQLLLGAPVSKEEVFQALMEMKPYKAPGPDGFQPIFYKMYWDVVGDDVWSFVRTAFATSFFDPQAVETLIVLIPKHEGPRHLKDFQPISLCNVLHKLISKVLVNRLRLILNRIVSPMQSSFLLGRSTNDNAILVQEIIHSMSKSQRVEGDLILKLDLEKAYDRVDWSFLRRVLIDLGFPPHIISLIMHGVSSASLCLLWNGQKTGTITPRRGLRQGDPLSPYLFVLCMERLGLLITKEVEEGSWSPYRLRGGPAVSHLFFADDVLLFSKAKTSSMRTIMKVIDLFCDASGMRVNLSKSMAFASQRVSPVRRRRLARISQIHFSSSLGKYLGYRMVHGRVKSQHFQDLVEKVQQRLSSWRGRLLNKARRLALVNSVLTSIPTYNMHIQWLPNQVCEKLDMLARRFLWSGQDKRGLHLVKWETSTQRRKDGGLGVRPTRLQNVALIGKQVWDLMYKLEKLWVHFVKWKYLGADITSMLQHSGSFFLSSLRKAYEALEEGFHLRLGQGECSFWFNPWIDGSPLSSRMTYIDLNDVDLEVRHVVSSDGCCDLARIASPLIDDLRELLSHLRLYLHHDIPDVLAWQGDESGVYSVCTGYAWLLARSTPRRDGSWGWLWKLKLPA
uniref:Transposon TX1 uncharacterized n=1 Tax=Cajanus cajan TaxID=3821 RepID=A0A151SIE2_CAJCA|nr:Transposon TX1 uncharacterized [Cajanus cajan]